MINQMEMNLMAFNYITQIEQEIAALDEQINDCEDDVKANKLLNRQDRLLKQLSDYRNALVNSN